MIAQVRTVLAGRVRPFRQPGEFSAIAKSALEGRIAIGRLGLAGDEQADRVHHGGVDKAIHHYPFDHYDFWRGQLGDNALLSVAGAFGENISTSGIVESDLCIGDRLRLGTALVEVSQGRQPCWKLDHRFGVAGVSAAVVRTGHCGWYYRVIEAGTLEAGQHLELIDRPQPSWTVEHAFALLIRGTGRRDTSALRELCKLDALAESWKRRALAMTTD